MSAVLGLRPRLEPRGMLMAGGGPQFALAATSEWNLVARTRPAAPAAVQAPVRGHAVARIRSARASHAGDAHRRQRTERDPRAPRRRGQRGERPRIVRRTEQAASALVASSIHWCRQHWMAAIKGQFLVHEIADLASLEHAVRTAKPDLVLVDQALLGPAIEGARAIHRLAAVSRVMVLAKSPDDAEALAAIKAGAQGYCDRNIDGALLAKAVAVLLAGEFWIGRGLITRLVDELAFAARRATPAHTEFAARLHDISERQREVLDLLSTGATNKEIACQLGVTTRTVKAHLGAVFAKVGIWGRVRLTAALHEHARLGVGREIQPRPKTDRDGQGVAAGRGPGREQPSQPMASPRSATG